MTKKEEKTKNDTQSTTGTQNHKPPLKTGSEFVTCTELEKLNIITSGNNKQNRIQTQIIELCI